MNKVFFIHTLINKLSFFQYKVFDRALNHCEKTQRNILSNILTEYQAYDALKGINGKTDYESFAQAIPICNYSDLKQIIENEQRLRGSIISKDVEFYS